MSELRRRDRPRRRPLTAHAQQLHVYLGPVRGRVHPGSTMMREEILAETIDPHGGRVVLLRRVWEGKLLRDHAELDAHLSDVLHTVAQPDHVASDPSSFNRTRY